MLSQPKAMAGGVGIFISCMAVDRCPSHAYVAGTEHVGLFTDQRGGHGEHQAGCVGGSFLEYSMFQQKIHSH